MGKMFSPSSNIEGGDNPLTCCLGGCCYLDSLSKPQKESITYPKSLASVRAGV